MYKIVFLILPLLFSSCDFGSGIFPIKNNNNQIDSITFRLDSLSYRDSGSAGSNQYSFSCNNINYYQFNVSFFGETNIDSVNIIGSPLIAYKIFDNGTEISHYEFRGLANINKYHSDERFSNGDSLCFYAGYSNAQGEMLKYVKLYSLIVICIRWY